MSNFQIEKTGYGAGSREYKDFPNVLRLMLGETNDEQQAANNEQIETLILLETNIDDLSPEISGFVLERAFAAGALDVWFAPIVMKKSRPAVQISILCRAEDKEKFLQLLFRETSTLGVRETEIKRRALPRETVLVETVFGAIDVKIAKSNGKILKAAPEYEQCRAAALEFDVPLREIERAALKAYDETREND
jgi:uncharacterized protein (DUF111 family)